MKCENPKMVYNKYIRRYVLVPCKTCSACRALAALSLADRVRNEIKAHRYNIFFTLTYDDDHVPCVTLSDDHVYRGVNHSEVLGVVDTFFDVMPYPIPTAPDHMSCFCYSDFQLFIKRLRERVNYNLYGTKKMQFQLRYFVCGEYGTKFHRAHLHGVVHCDSKKVAEEVISSIPACWQFCDWHALVRSWYRAGCPRKRYPLPQYCSVFTSSYVATYVASCASDSPLFSFGEFRPFCKYSKIPTYGLSAFDKQVLDRPSVSEDFGRLFEKIVKVGFPVTYRVCSKGLLSSFFPVSVYFDRLSDKTQSSLYWLTLQQYGSDIGDLRALEDLRSVPVKEGGDSLTNHVIKIFQACKRFLRHHGLELSEGTWLLYLELRKKFHVAYASALVFMSMRRFDPDNPIDYVLSSYNNFLPGAYPYLTLSVYEVWLPMTYICNMWRDFLSPSEKVDLVNFLDKFKTLLLPKHFNGLLINF